ncbi:MAG: hypothetical protein ACTHJ9_10360 [Rhodanobacter sp.]
MNPRRRITDQPHPAHTPGAWPVASGVLLFWALVLAAIIRCKA